MSETVVQTEAMLLRRTPDQILGPFYPVHKRPDPSGDLTRGKGGTAEGMVLHLGGRVLMLDGTPVAGATVEIWQANRHGRYDHPGDTSAVPLDPNFQGFGVTTTDAAGRYGFTTIKPMAYRTGPESWRPAHIHFAVTTRAERLVTQMYFAGDPYNATDPFLQSARRQEALIVSLLPPEAGQDAASRLVVFDIVLATG
jgi:protocatechuate 3,4-dioxygenase beta subunit